MTIALESSRYHQILDDIWRLAREENFSGMSERVAPLRIGRQFSLLQRFYQYNGTCKIYKLNLLSSRLSNAAHGRSSDSVMQSHELVKYSVHVKKISSPLQLLGKHTGDLRLISQTSLHELFELAPGLRPACRTLGAFCGGNRVCCALGLGGGIVLL